MQRFEYRGVDNLVFAEVTTDTIESYVTGEVKSLAAVAEIGKTTEGGSEAKYYDNKPLFTISSAGADTLTIVCTPLELEILANITGRHFDAEKGYMLEGERKTKYFAIGYRTKGTDGHYRYVWRYKGSFAIPEETNATENAGTDTTNMTLTYTGIGTTHVMAQITNEKGESEDVGVQALVVDTRYNKADVSTFFDKVIKPEELKVKATTTT